MDQESQAPESPINPERVTDGDPQGDEFIPEDVHIELPFPMLLANKGSIILCGKVVANKAVQVMAIDAVTGAVLCELGSPLTAPPHGEDIGQHWVTLISYVAKQVLAKVGRPWPIAETDKNGLVKVGAF